MRGDDPGDVRAVRARVRHDAQRVAAVVDLPCGPTVVTHFVCVKERGGTRLVMCDASFLRVAPPSQTWTQYESAEPSPSVPTCRATRNGASGVAARRSPVPSASSTARQPPPPASPPPPGRKERVCLVRWVRERR